MKTLTTKQRQFALAYAETGNRVEAYRRAYNCAKMAQRTIQRKAQHVAGLPHVAARIEELAREAVTRSGITVDEVIQRYMAIVEASITDFIEQDGDGIRFKDLDNLSIEQCACIRRVKVGRDGRLEMVELHDKIQALQHLGKHLGMFERRQQDPVQVVFDIRTDGDHV